MNRRDFIRLRVIADVDMYQNVLYCIFSRILLAIRSREFDLSRMWLGLLLVSDVAIAAFILVLQSQWA